uniref:Uncharacterized protein n=1 Tax=Anguilla anguilla TaxID=7936 RepID=A0A0E9U8W5_ANGAN
MLFISPLFSRGLIIICHCLYRLTPLTELMKARRL